MLRGAMRIVSTHLASAQCAGFLCWAILSHAAVTLSVGWQPRQMVDAEAKPAIGGRLLYGEAAAILPPNSSGGDGQS